MHDKILHIVIFSITPDTTEGRIEKVKNMFLDLKGTIDGLESVTWHNNISKSRFAADWQVGCLMTFTDINARDHFLDHPDHKLVSAETSNGFYKGLVVYDINYS
jgi:hypothetical protein